MAESASLDSALPTIVAEQITLHRVRFTSQGEDADTVLMSFADPSPMRALATSTRWERPFKQRGEPSDDGLDLLAVAAPPQDSPTLREELGQWVNGPASAHAPPPIGAVLHGAQVFWRAGRAAILAAPERLEALLPALVDFSYYENELRKLERAVSDAWPGLEGDTRLTLATLPTDLEPTEAFNERMNSAVQRRIRFARLSPHLYRASADFSLAAQELGTRLREKARVEDRLDALERQIEAFDRVYEMASQRLSEHRTSRQERTLEWIIIVLLAAETLMLLADLLYHLER